MSSSRDQRYTPEEFEMIVERAAALQDESNEASPRLETKELAHPDSDEGMTLQAVREIAAEVGVEPRFVEEAARSLQLRAQHSVSATVLGAPLRYDARGSFPQAPGGASLSQLVERIRAEMGHDGEAREILDSVEWATVGRMTKTTVALRDHDEGTDVQVRVDASGLAALTWVGSVGLGVLAGGAVASAVDPATTFGIATALGVGVGGGIGLGMARAAWSRVGHSLQARARRLRDTVGRLVR